MTKKTPDGKIDVATKYHDIVGMLDTHQSEVDVMVNGNKTFFKTSMIHS